MADIEELLLKNNWLYENRVLFNIISPHRTRYNCEILGIIVQRAHKLTDAFVCYSNMSFEYWHNLDVYYIILL